MFSELGFVFQNLVYHLLSEKMRESGGTMHYWRTKEKAEVDFIINNGNDVIPVEVKCSELKDKSLPRSLKGFIARYNPKEAWLINLCFKEQYMLGDTQIRFVPYYEILSCWFKTETWTNESLQFFSINPRKNPNFLLHWHFFYVRDAVKIILYVCDEWAVAHFFFPIRCEQECCSIQEMNFFQISKSYNESSNRLYAIFHNDWQNMNTYREKIRELIEPLIESENMELVDLECLKMKTRWLVRIYMDKDGGVTIDDCSEISKQAGDILDVHDVPPGPYTLEVSSPGLDRPLTRDKDFIKYRRHKVHIRTGEKLEGIKNFRGELIDYCDENGRKTLIVTVSGKIYHIPRDLVIKANLEYEF